MKRNACSPGASVQHAQTPKEAGQQGIEIVIGGLPNEILRIMLVRIEQISAKVGGEVD
jgi:hypothetical protein